MENGTAYAKAYSHPTLNSVIDLLLFNQFIQDKNTGLTAKEIEIEDLKKAVFVASLLASSEDEQHLLKAQLFSSLLYLQKGKNADVEKICYVLMSRLGNLAATNLFARLGWNPKEQISEAMYSYDALLGLELAVQKTSKTIEFGNEIISATRFQKHLWDELRIQKRLSISAPTSAGKSFISKKYIKTLYTSAKRPVHCLYIVPSRALINQVSEEFRGELNGLASVYTSFLEVKEGYHSSIYVLTPERCLRLLKLAPNIELAFDLIFVDEVQNVEDEGGRGTLLEYVMAELVRFYSAAQIVVAGPNLDAPSELLAGLIRESAAQVKSTLSPVIQIRSVVRRLDNEQISINILSNFGDKIQFTLNIGYDLNLAFKNSVGAGLANMVMLFAKDEQSIIYSPKTNFAEKWALAFVRAKGENATEIDRQVEELIEYLKEEMHPQYFLIKCLAAGVAFHHSKLPELVRKEVEDCFLDKKLNKLFCTSTLIEGVNLPAVNLFVVMPQKRTEDLSSFEFGNLIGRAGRLGDSLYGNVYCLEREDHYDWADKYFGSSFDKKVVPATDKALNRYETLIEKILLASTEIDKQGELEKNAIILFRHKFMLDPNDFSQYLFSKGLDKEKTTIIVEKIAQSVSEIEIPVEVSRVNPSIDPLLQDKLHRRIKAEGIEQWVVHPNANLRKPISKVDIGNYAIKDANLYWQLLYIMNRMDEIFSIRTETWIKHQISRKISQMCFYGIRWLEGQSYSKMIRDDIAWKIKMANDDFPFDSTNENDINTVINEVAKINITIVSHVLVKYIKLLNDILEPLMTEEQREKFKFSLALPGMLELGTTNSTAIQLVSGGISRSVALKVVTLFEQVPGYEELNVFNWLKSNRTLNLKPIYNRYLSKLHLLKAE